MKPIFMEPEFDLIDVLECGIVTESCGDVTAFGLDEEVELDELSAGDE